LPGSKFYTFLKSGSKNLTFKDKRL